MATLALCTHEGLVRLNVLKGMLSLVIATVTVVSYLLVGP
jgi:hypothetical protein